MNLQEYRKVENFSYNAYCDYLKEKYGKATHNYFPSGNRRSQEGLFLHHIGEIKVASLSNPVIAKANDPKYQEPEYLCYCDYLEHALLHIMIGEETAGSRNLGLQGDNLFIIPAMRSFFEEGLKQNNYNDAYYDRIKDDKDVYDLIWKRYNDTVEKADIVIEHNKVLYLQMEEALEKHNKALVVLGTGLGKTTTALQYLWKHQCKGLVIGPNNLIKNGWEAYGEWVAVTTYQSFANTYKDIDYSQYGLVILDEAHHAGYDAETDKGAAVWAKGIDYIISQNIKLLGLTATPIRSDGINIGKTIFKDCVCEGRTVEEAIEEKIIHPFSYITAIYDKSKLLKLAAKYNDGSEECNRLMGQLNLAINNSLTLKEILLKYMPKDTKRKGIIFIQEIADEHYAKEIFKTVYPNMEYRAIHSDMDSREIDENRKWFEEVDEGYLLAVNMISEGAHYKGVNTLIMFRRTQSYLVYTQQLGRIITLVKDKNPNAVVFDLVNNIEEIRYNDRKLNKRKNDKYKDITRIREALKKVKSDQIIIADETRDIVENLRRIKSNYLGKLTREMREEIDTLYTELGPRNLQKMFEQKYYYQGSHYLIALYAKEHNLVYLNKRQRKNEDMEKIKKLHYQGLNYKEIAKEMNMTYQTIQSRLRTLGLQKKNNNWTKEEIIIGEKYYKYLGPYELHNKYLPNRTVEQIKYQATRQHWGRDKETYKTNPRIKKVICIETGLIYNSARQASLSLGLNSAAISISISKNLKCGGYHWRYVDE